MRAKSLFFVTLLLVSTVFVNKAGQPGAGMRNIVDLEDVLNITTPLESSTVPLRSQLDSKFGQTSETQLNGQKTRAGQFNKEFLNYLKENYNRPELTEVLTYDASDISNFLKLAADLNLDAGTVYVGLRLFHNKIKACDLILDKATLDILVNFNDNLGRYFVTTQDFQKTEIDAIQKSLEKIILNKLSDQFASQAIDLPNVAAQLSQDISKFIDQGMQEFGRKYEARKSVERLRQTVIRFTETLLSKTVWDEQRPNDIWPSFILISDILQKMALNEIIDHMDDLDDLFWSLTHTFCRYFASFGIAIPTANYEKIEQDLKNNTIYFLEATEQEDGIKTKKEHIYNTLFKSKIKAYAFEKKGDNFPSNLMVRAAFAKASAPRHAHHFKTAHPE